MEQENGEPTPLIVQADPDIIDLNGASHTLLSFACSPAILS
jgi:hypothetical protein